MNNAIIIGVEHYMPESFEKVKQVIDKADREKCIFLLEYDAIRYRKHQRKKKWVEKIRKLLGLNYSHYDEFYELTEYLKRKNYKFRYVDSKGIELAKQFYKKSSIISLINLSGTNSEEKREDKNFNEYFIEKREQAMIDEIKTISGENLDNAYLIVGKEHVNSMENRLIDLGVKCYKV